MRGKHWLNRLYLALVAVLLVATVVAVPIAWSRYVAQAEIQATSSVAKFDAVWENNDLGALPTTVGLTQGAVVFHPGNWTANIPIAWTLFNKSEVAVTVLNQANQIQLKMSNPEPTGRHNDALRIGQYYYTGGWADLNMSVALGGGSPTPPTTPVYLLPAGATFARPEGMTGDRLKFKVDIRGYNSAPAAPATNWTYGQNAAMHTLNMATSPYWRTYRANAEIRVTQVD